MFQTKQAAMTVRTALVYRSTTFVSHFDAYRKRRGKPASSPQDIVVVRQVYHCPKKAVVEEALRRLVRAAGQSQAIADMAGLGWDTNAGPG